MTHERRNVPIHVERLTESYRFDDEMAALLTQFQYCEDGITLTANEERPVPARAVNPATSTLKTIFTSRASLVFICYDERGHRMVNPIETALIQAIADAVATSTAARPDGGTAGPLGEGPAATKEGQRGSRHGQSGDDACDVSPGPSLGVVTPHNAQRGALETVLPGDVTANTVEKYQGGERDIIAVSATVSNPAFARREERFTFL